MEAKRRGRAEGRVAVITGGGRGIGKATVLVFAEEGAKVGIVDVDEGKGKALVERLEKLYPGEKDEKRFLFVKCDISNENQVAETMKTIVNIVYYYLKMK
eukprot:TRINITY_DN2727_c0_g1_i2.p2 TRINITY_DN2727_c0_g1~~TRINITY_DN2727_c0_g1_i2.p2  ORF type:complete len:110 (+),score=49.61 TRINITY_DN2727_c0_g1_i2:32-331(+)